MVVHTTILLRGISIEQTPVWISMPSILTVWKEQGTTLQVVLIRITCWIFRIDIPLTLWLHKLSHLVAQPSRVSFSGNFLFNSGLNSLNRCIYISCCLIRNQTFLSPEIDIGCLSDCIWPPWHQDRSEITLTTCSPSFSILQDGLGTIPRICSQVIIDGFKAFSLIAVSLVILCKIILLWLNYWIFQIKIIEICASIFKIGPCRHQPTYFCFNNFWLGLSLPCRCCGCCISWNHAIYLSSNSRCFHLDFLIRRDSITSLDTIIRGDSNVNTFADFKVILISLNWNSIRCCFNCRRYLIISSCNSSLVRLIGRKACLIGYCYTVICTRRGC